MREERRLSEWLAEYRDSLDLVSSPAELEFRLRAEVRRRRRVAVAPWILAAGAAAALVLGIWIGRARPEAAVIPTVVSAPQIMERSLPEPSAAEAVVVRTAPRRIPVSAQVEARPIAVFVMLPGSELMPPTQALQIMRVQIPRTRIQALGWPVNADRLDERVLADVVVGDDGLARAVRLVQANQ